MQSLTFQLSYIASAIGFMKALHWRDDTEEAECGVYLNECLKRLQGRHNHSVGLLFNAYTERDMGKRMHAQFPNAAEIYGDSGGLQVVSRGLPVTNEIKDAVYRSQATHATIGMCFDQIPVEIAYTVSHPNFIGNRKFRFDLVEPAAKETAHNIRRQIDVYDEMHSNCRPIVIMQGNCYDSFQKWAQVIVRELGDYHLSRCAGIALADTAHGLGMFDDIERMHIGSRLDIPPELNKHIHLLGIGRIRRLLPMVILANNGFFPHTETISYDSSTHTRQLTIGYHFMDGIMTRFGLDNLSKYKRVANNIITQTKDLFGYDIDPAVLKDILLSGPRTTDRDTGERKDSKVLIEIIKTCISTCLVSIDNFNSTVVNSLTDKELMMRAVLNSKHEFYALNQVKTHDDFYSWARICGKRMKTQRVMRHQENPLEDMFA